jgi:aminoglycoside N3'-acetyltransferase
MADWTTKDVKVAIIGLGIPSDSLVFVHSNLGMLGRSSDASPSSSMLNVFEDFFGRSGGFILPAFTYSLSSGVKFNPSDREVLRPMGQLSLDAFDRDYVRVNDPIFSCFGFGPRFNHLAKSDSRASFGPESFFGKLVDSDPYVLNIGTGAGSTLLHELERRIGVRYRHDKYFSYQGQLDNQNPMLPNEWLSYVRNLEMESSEADFRMLSKLVRNEEFYSQWRVGKTLLSCYKISSMFEYLKTQIQNKPNLLNRKGFKLEF